MQDTTYESLLKCGGLEPKLVMHFVLLSSTLGLRGYTSPTQRGNGHSRAAVAQVALAALAALVALVAPVALAAVPVLLVVLEPLVLLVVQIELVALVVPVVLVVLVELVQLVVPGVLVALVFLVVGTTGSATGATSDFFSGDKPLGTL